MGTADAGESGGLAIGHAEEVHRDHRVSVHGWCVSERCATTAQTARCLAISPHTVNEHVKAIYDKTGARTRGEVLATVFCGQHLPRIQGQVGVSDDASFVDAPRPRA